MMFGGIWGQLFPKLFPTFPTAHLERDSFVLDTLRGSFQGCSPFWGDRKDYRTHRFTSGRAVGIETTYPWHFSDLRRWPCATSETSNHPALPTKSRGDFRSRIAE